jgi:hypothetical protein
MSVFSNAELSNCALQDSISPLVLSVNTWAAEFVSLLVIKLKITGNIFMKMRQANLTLVVFTAVVMWFYRTHPNACVL